MKKVKKIAITIIPVVIAFFSLSAPTYAIKPQQFGAWIAAALQAINITATATSMATADISRDFMDWLSRPVKIVASEFVDVPYTTPMNTVDEYLSRATLQIDKDKVTIDGVEYTDVWLSNEASEKFRVNAFDLENAFDIASQSEGTFVSGVGFCDGVPMFNFGTYCKSPTYKGSLPGTYTSGNILVETTQTPGSTSRFDTLITYSDGRTQTLSPKMEKSNDDNSLRWSITNNNSVFNTTSNILKFTSRFTSANVYIPSNLVGTESFDFDWIAGEIPADEVLPENQGLRIRVPTDDIADWYTEYPEMGESVIINMGDPDLEAKVDDLIDLIIPLIPILDIEFTTQDTPEPQPEPEPIPDPEPYPDPLPDPTISLIDSTLKDIVQALKNLYDNISIGNSISEAIKNLSDKIKWTLDDIKEAIGDLTSKIVSGNADWFRDIVESIWEPFLPIFNIFKAGLGIWRYVVEWLEFISSPFIFFWNTLGSASYYARTPIYALAAASIVIAIYRRFGR